MTKGPPTIVINHNNNDNELKKKTCCCKNMKASYFVCPPISYLFHRGQVVTIPLTSVSSGPKNILPMNTS